MKLGTARLWGVMAATVALLLGRPIAPAHADDREKVVGVWTLVSVLYEDVQTKERWPVLGEHPRGRQIATADGRWLALVTAEGRPIPKTDEDRARALRTMIAYTGRYTVDAEKIVTEVEAAWNEAWVGTEQVRLYRFEGDRLLIESPPQPHPNLDGRMVKIIVVWQREKA
jgi:hypothetical protein